MEIRRLVSEDVEAVIQLWHQGWHDAHAEIVPRGVLAYRTPGHFRIWMNGCKETFHVAHEEGRVVGFVSVAGREVVKLYVDRDRRGAGVAAALLGFAERALTDAGAVEARLLCTAGNKRAETFYLRHGWTLLGTCQDTLWVPPDVGQTFNVPTHTYRKVLAASSDRHVQDADNRSPIT
jgi:GNAT superfamily N-acetyltransferase